MTDYTPTVEQAKIIDAAKTGSDLVIEAGAGTGKTSTLVKIAEAMPTKTVLYAAYNKSIQLDAADKFPTNTTVKTVHSLAWKAVIQNMSTPLAKRLKGGKISARQVAANLGVKAPLSFNIDGEDRSLDQEAIARIALATVTNFCQSAKTEIEAYMVPTQDGLETKRDEIAAVVLPLAQAAWKDLNADYGNLKFDHGHYLKMFQLANPVLPYDVILYDEAQDANPVIASIITNQDAQIILVGDRAQAIYGWNGAVDAMENFNGQRLLLSQSFRFGPAIADEANRFLALLDTPLRLTGHEPIKSTVTNGVDPDTILCRTNAGVIETALAQQERGRKAAIVGGTREIEAFIDAADELMQGIVPKHPELCAFRNWADVQRYAGTDDGQDLRTMVRLVDLYGTGTIRQVCRNSVNENAADVIVSTAHKSKGREWDNVRIHSDFGPRINQETGEAAAPSRTDIMLMYVAVTRAKLDIDHNILTWVFDHAAKLAESA